MIKDHTLDEAIIEAARFIKAAKSLRKTLSKNRNPAIKFQGTQMMGGIPANVTSYEYISPYKDQASVKRASLDLTRKLADLRQGR